MGAGAPVMQPGPAFGRKPLITAALVRGQGHP